MTAYYAELVAAYPLVSIEDPLAEDDWDGWKVAHRPARRQGAARRRRPVRHQPRAPRPRHRRAAPPTPCWSRSTRSARSPRPSTPSSWPSATASRCMMCHRSGETEDTTIADLAVATNCGQIKTGAPARSERVAKYNQLLRIEEEPRRRRGVRRPPAPSRASPAASRAEPERWPPDAPAVRRRDPRDVRTGRARGRPPGPRPRHPHPRRPGWAGAGGSPLPPRTAAPAAVRRCCRSWLFLIVLARLPGAAVRRASAARSPHSQDKVARPAAGRASSCATRRRAGSDPAYVEQQARQRLHFVMPGETSYIVLDAKPTAGTTDPWPAWPRPTRRCPGTRPSGASPATADVPVGAPVTAGRRHCRPIDAGRRRRRQAAARPAARAGCARSRTAARAASPTWCETAPRLPDGTPVPDALLPDLPARRRRAIGTLEADGVMREMTERLASDPELRAALAAAHEDYIARRDASSSEVPEVAGVSAGGMPDRVKCLHVLVAHALAAGPGRQPAGRRGARMLASGGSGTPARPTRRARRRVRRPRHRAGAGERTVSDGIRPASRRSTAARTRSACWSPTSARRPARRRRPADGDRPARPGRRPHRAARARGAGAHLRALPRVRRAVPRRSGAERVRFVATSASRDAANRDEFVAGCARRSATSVSSPRSSPATRRRGSPSPARPASCGGRCARPVPGRGHRRRLDRVRARHRPTSGGALRRHRLRADDRAAPALRPADARRGGRRPARHRGRPRRGRGDRRLTGTARVVGLAGTVTTIAALALRPAELRPGGHPPRADPRRRRARGLRVAAGDDARRAGRAALPAPRAGRRHRRWRPGLGRCSPGRCTARRVPSS